MMETRVYMTTFQSNTISLCKLLCIKLSKLTCIQL